MKIHCPACNAKILPDDLNLQNLVARCRGCASVFSFRSQLEGADLPAAKGVPVVREVPMPAKFHVERSGHRTSITWRWFGVQHLILLFVCLFWNGFLVFWYSVAMRDGAPLAMKLFPLVHVAVGLIIAYITLGGFLNRTVVAVDGKRLVVRHGPLPWLGNRDLPAGELKQLYCSLRVTHSRNSGSRTYYDVNAVLQDGRKERLLRGLEEPEQALFVEQAIEEVLVLPDERVPGEMPK